MKNDKNMKATDIKTSKDEKEYITKCINDYENGVTSKNKTVLNIMEYGSHKLNIGLARKPPPPREIEVWGTRGLEIF